MDNEKIENKVILTLEDYLKMRDSKINQDKNIQELLNLLFDSVELNKDKTDLRISLYNLKIEKILILLKKIDNERYINLMDILKKEE